MKKYLKYILLFVLLLIPLNINAISKDYNDIVYKIVGQTVEENKINVYFFHSDTCPHCKKEKVFLEDIKDKYNINIYMYEVSESVNSNYLNSIKKLFNETSNGVPYTVIGEEKFLGFSDSIGTHIEECIQNYLNEKSKTEEEINTKNIPILGKVNTKTVSLPVVAVILGFIDGFNPCAMWVLLFLINMLFNMHNKKKMLLLGYTFLFTSALVYFLSMLGISFILNITTIGWIQKAIGLVAIIVGILNVSKYIKEKDEDGCHVVDDKKRKKMFKRINKITNEKNIFLALVGIVVLAASVNIVEMACSLGFPAIFSEILSLNKVSSIMRIIYILIYVLLYMIDDFIVFTIAVFTLSISTKSTKYTKYINLIAGFIMVIMGMLLIFKPEWVMLNF